MKKPLFEIEGLEESNRGEYRLYPSDEDNIKLIIAGKAVEVDNISANGIAFKFIGNVKKATYKVVLEFTLDEKHSIECAVKVLRQAPPIYSGTLVDLSPSDSRLISQLIINSQKRSIRRGAKK
ncbi:MAG: hypothetical protein ACPG4U_07315 [Pseudomonadales bacterium]